MNDNWNTDNQDNNYYRTDSDQKDYSDKEPRSKGRNVFVSYKQNNRNTHSDKEVFYGSPQQPRTVYEANSRPKPKRKYKALKIIIPIFIILAIIGFISNAFEEYEEITKSTVHRQALAEGLVDKTGYLSDETGWLSDKSDTLEGLREFYKKTGVQPYLYVTDNINDFESPTIDDLEFYANTLYDELFTDEAHLLLVFYYDQEYMACCLRGTQAETVIDDQAANILLDYVDHYYYKDTLDSSFRYVFTKAAGRIMTVTKPPFAMAIIVIVVAVALGLLYWWWQHNKKKKAKEEQLMEDILDTPLEKFGDLEVEELADKYEDTDESL